jgi:hypothetical protein
LGQQQGPDHVDLELMTHIRLWDVEDRHRLRKLVGIVLRVIVSQVHSFLDRCIVLENRELWI